MDSFSASAASVAHPRPFRFGVKLREAATPEAWAERARRAEALGYATVLLPDHFGHPLAPLPAALAAALATTRLRVGTSVLCNDFRHPAVLAHEAASIDWLTGGRLELGLGAGWKREDYAWTGIARDPAARRIERLEESLVVLRALFAGGPVDFSGRHYEIRGLPAAPKPAQPGGPPLLVGGGGRMLLGVAARHADIASLNPRVRSGVHDAETDLDGSPAATDRKLEWLREAAGERFERIEIAAELYLARLSDDRAAADEALRGRFRMPLPEVRSALHGLAGSLAELRDELEARRARWSVSYWIVPPQAMEEMAPLVAELTGR